LPDATGSSVTSGDLVTRRSSHRIKRLPWADLGRILVFRPRVLLGDSKTAHVQVGIWRAYNQVEEIE
jgi:hypothetical protein